jgi:ribosomal protein L14
MLMMESLIDVIDNSGVKKVKIIKVYNYGDFIGRIFIASVYLVKPRRKIKKGDLIKGLILRLSSITFNMTGYLLKSFSNGSILLKKTENIPYGNRIKTVIYLNIRKNNFNKILILSRYVC